MRSMVDLEKQISDDRAKWEGLGATIAAVFRLWRDYGSGGDTPYVAKPHARASLTCDDIFDEALHHSRDDEALRAAAELLAYAIQHGVQVYCPAGHAKEECEFYCAEHEECCSEAGQCYDCNKQREADAKADHYDTIAREARWSE